MSLLEGWTCQIVMLLSTWSCPVGQIIMPTEQAEQDELAGNVHTLINASHKVMQGLTGTCTQLSDA